MREKTMNELVEDLEFSTASLAAAEQRESYARQETTACRNQVNQAQKALSARMQTLRKNAPRDSAWEREAT